MTPSLVTIDASEPLETILSIIARDGGVIVSNLLSPELLKETMNASECQVFPTARGVGHNSINGAFQSNLISRLARYTTPRRLTASWAKTSSPRALSVSL
jgi:hypothetical protein